MAKLLNDPIHGHINLSPSLLQLIDTTPFQRLRDLKQLGSCYYVFPGASHNRFEHSIGTAHLAEQMLLNLQRNQPELGITDHDIFLVQTAALCHDLGHGPFSHVFDNEFIPAARPGVEWSHEDASIMMLNFLLSEYQRENPSSPPLFSDDDRQFLAQLINPYSFPRTRKTKTFLYDIVSNSRNSVDVDKFDYLSRDSYNLDMKISWAHDRIMKNVRVIEDEICFSDKDSYHIYEMFHSRYSLFKQVYSHKVAKAVEYMITDVLLLADPILHISQSIHDPHQYLKMTDCLLKQIEVSDNPDLAPAQALIHRIRTRRLYKIVDEAIIPVTKAPYMNVVTEHDIVACVPHGMELKVDDIKVHNLKMNYAMQDKNPVDSVSFYNKKNPNQKFHVPKHKVSYLIPEHFQERYLRVYLKDTTEAKFNAARQAMHIYLRGHDCISPAVTPSHSHSHQHQHQHHHFDPEAAALAAALRDDPDFTSPSKTPVGTRLRAAAAGVGFEVYSGAKIFDTPAPIHHSTTSTSTSTSTSTTTSTSTSTSISTSTSTSASTSSRAPSTPAAPAPSSTSSGSSSPTFAASQASLASQYQVTERGLDNSSPCPTPAKRKRSPPPIRTPLPPTSTNTLFASTSRNTSSYQTPLQPHLSSHPTTSTVTAAPRKNSISPTPAPEQTRALAYDETDSKENITMDGHDIKRSRMT